MKAHYPEMTAMQLSRHEPSVNVTGWRTEREREREFCIFSLFGKDRSHAVKAFDSGANRALKAKNVDSNTQTFSDQKTDTLVFSPIFWSI